MPTHPFAGGRILELANRVAITPRDTVRQSSRPSTLHTRSMPGNRAPRQITFSFNDGKTRTETGRWLLLFLKRYSVGGSFKVNVRGTDVDLVLIPSGSSVQISNGRTTATINTEETLATD